MSINPGAALGLFAVLSLAAGVILWHLDRRTALQVEWNPWSPLSRAERAWRSGREGEALRYFTRAGRRDQVRRVIESGLPSGALGGAFQQATAEFFAVTDSVAALQATGRPELIAFAGSLTADLDAAERALWDSFDRTRLATRLAPADADDSPARIAESAKLAAVTDNLRSARQALADLAQGAGDEDTLTETAHRFRLVAETTEALRDWLV